MAWDPRRSPTGNPLTDELIPLAERLVAAVHHNRTLGVNTAFADAETIAGCPVKAAQGLAVVLAGMCPDDESAASLLSWRRNPTEYHRLRRAGVTAAAARQLVDRVTRLLTRTTARPTDPRGGGVKRVVQVR